MLSRPLGLYLSGGGALGAWQAGALEVLAPRLEFSRVAGFSVGALHGAAYCFGKVERMREIWSRIEHEKILRFSPKWSPFSLYGNESLRSLARLATGADPAREILRPLTVLCYCPAERRYVHARYEPGRLDGHLEDHLVASCSIPVVFPPVRVGAGAAALDLVDGGVRSDAELSFAGLEDCKDVLVLQMVRPDELDRRPWWPWQRREQQARVWLWRHLEQGLGPLAAGGSRVMRLWPSRRLDFTMLSFSDRHCAEAWELGRRDAEAFLADPEKAACAL